MSVSSAPIFIIGTERSGSNLLRLILDTHSDVCIPHPPHIMRYFAPIADGYGDLNKLPARTKLARDIRRLIDTHIFPWEYPIDWDAVTQNPPENSLFGLVAGIYEQVRMSSGKQRWGNKSTFMIHHVDAVLNIYPDAHFVWLVRDPRDVAVSSKTSVFNPFAPRNTATLWDHQQQLGIALEQNHPERVHRLYYETLISEPEGTITELCARLGLSYEANMLTFFDQPEANKSSQLSESWMNTGKPILGNNAGKYRSKLTTSEIQDVESIASATMADLGYSCDTPNSDFSDTTSALASWWKERSLHAVVELRSLIKDKNDLLRRQRALLMTWLTLRRNPKHLLPWT